VLKGSGGNMKLRFWLLDVNHETRAQKPEVWLWGIDDKGQRVLIIDSSFHAYFYLVLKEEADPQAVIKSIEARRATDFSSIIKLEAVERKYFSKSVNAVKVMCHNPDLVAKYAKVMSKIEGVKESLEDDIRYSMRYVIDNQMTPCGWHEIEAEQIDNTVKAQVDKVYKVESPPKSIEKAEVPKLRILAFSTLAYSPKGAAKPERDPVAIVSTATSQGEEKQFVAKDSDDKAVLEAFVRHVRDFDPDVIVGYGTNRQDWNYLSARSKKLGAKLFVDRANAEPHMSVYGHVSVTGRANVDLFDFADELPQVKVKTLENVADFLNVMPLEKRTLVEEVDYAAYWEDQKKRSTLLRYSRENAQSVLGVAEAMLSFVMQLSNLVGLPLDHVGTAAVGFRVEWYLMREAFRIGELIPKRVERPYFPYAGAVVLAPKPGLHENIAVLDFKAMYPSIMIAYNVSPDTYVPSSNHEPKGGVNVAPEVKHRFRKEPPGFYKQVLSSLIAYRDQIRPKMSRLKPQSYDYRLLDARQKAVKVITNATYGYAGWIGARWYIKPVAEATTAWGRHTIQSTIELAKKVGLEVVYSDTDSVFVKNEPDKIKKVTSEVEKTLGLEIKPDEVYKRVLFTEAKKKYCGLLPNGQLDIVGLEVVRGDWAGCAKHVQENVLEIVLKEQAPEKAAEFVRTYVSNLRGKKVPYKDLIIWKTLTKKVEEYEVKAPHVEAAKRLLKEGYEFSMGDKIGYVITLGSGKLYERAKPYALASADEVDTEYYVTNQVLPVASRILVMFGIKEDALVSAKEASPKKLDQY
jgi:DNA polymerase I